MFSTTVDNFLWTSTARLSRSGHLFCMVEQVHYDLYKSVFNTFYFLPSGTLEVLNVQVTSHWHTLLRDVLTGL